MGDLITLETKEGDKGWWKGSLNGKVGFFPYNFVEEVGSTKKGELVDACLARCRVLYEYKPENEDELSLKVGDIVTDVDTSPKDGYVRPSCFLSYEFHCFGC